MENAIVMTRTTERFEITWPEGYTIELLTEQHQSDIAWLFHRTRAPLYHHPNGGTLVDAHYDVARYFRYHRDRSPWKDRYPLFLKASTLAYSADPKQLVGICQVAGSDTEGHIFNIFVDLAHRRNGLATCMLKRALTVLADTYEIVDLETAPDGVGRRVYEPLGFTFTGETT